MKLCALLLLLWAAVFLSTPAFSQDVASPKQEKSALKEAKKFASGLFAGLTLPRWPRSIPTILDRLCSAVNWASLVPGSWCQNLKKW